MKKNKFWLFLLLVLIGLILIAVYSTRASTNNSSKDEKLFVDASQKDLIKNSKAVLHYSTMSTQFLGGNSFSIFISNDNKATAFRMKPLELASMPYNKETQTLLLEDAASFKFVTDEGIVSKKFEKEELRGTNTGYLTQGNTFYSMYNSGADEEGAAYVSTLRYGNETGVKSTTIDEWVTRVTDNQKDTIYSLVEYPNEKTSDGNYRLVQSTLDKKNTMQTKVLKELKEFEKKKNLDFYTRLYYVKEKQYLYSVLGYSESNDKNGENMHYKLFKYDLNTNKASFYPLSDNSMKSFEYLTEKSGEYRDGENIYFLFDDGNVVQLNVNTHKLKTIYNLQKRHHYDEITTEYGFDAYIKGKYIYCIYEKQNGDYYFDKVILKTGEVIQSDFIKSMKEILEAAPTGMALYSMSIY